MGADFLIARADKAQIFSVASTRKSKFKETKAQIGYAERRKAPGAKVNQEDAVKCAGNRSRLSFL